MILSDERGVAYVETIIAVPVIFIVFAALFTFGHLAAGEMIVLRAASAAARAAVVFLPDDPEYYARDGAATREECVKEAARQVLLASDHFKIGVADVDVKIDGSRRDFEPLTVTVRAHYDCSQFIGSFVCGTDEIADMSSSAVLPYQEGPVEQQ